MANKKIGILTSGGDCGGLNAAIRSIFYRAKNKYNMDVFGIKDGTAGLMKRPVAAVQLTHKTFGGYLLRQGGTFLGSTNKGNPFKFPNKELHLKLHDVFKVSKEDWHQIYNPFQQECRIIEIQHGEETNEDDIERLEFYKGNDE